MKMKRRDFWKPLLGISAILPAIRVPRGHSAILETVDPEDCILVVDVHDDLMESEKTRIHNGLRAWKKEYPQLKNLPILVVDNGADINIIRRKDASKI